MALGFDGIDQFLAAPAPVAATTPIAMACWFRSGGGAGGQALVSLSNGDHAMPQLHRLMIEGQAGNRLKAQTFAASGQSAESSAPFSIGVWHHAFGVFGSATDRRVWLDGGNAATDTGAAAPTGLDWTSIAASRMASVDLAHFQGEIAEVAIWAGAGTDAMGEREAVQLARGFTPMCLGDWLGALVLYQPLVREVDRGIGPAMTAHHGPGAAAHPAVQPPVGPALGLYRLPSWAAPYRVPVAQAAAPSAHCGLAAGGGMGAGEIRSTCGEVAN